MKKYLIGLLLILGLVGCKSIPNSIYVYGLSTSAGVAAGYACELSGLDDNEKELLVDITDKLIIAVPNTNSTCLATWTPLINSELSKLLDAGRINQKQSIILTTILLSISEGCDYLIDKNNWNSEVNILSSVVHGFCVGIKSVLGTRSSARSVDNHEIYSYVKTRLIIRSSKRIL